MEKERDPLNVERDLYELTSLIAKRLLDELRSNASDMTIPQWIQALTAAGRLQLNLVKLKESGREPDEQPGSVVRKYSQAFSPGNSGRAAYTGYAPDLDAGDEDGDTAA